MRILVIEDDSALCEALSLHLTREGYSVDICQNGADAEYYLKRGEYGAIILDRMLPEADGLSILKRSRAAGLTTPVLMLTALDTVSDRTDGLDAGADDYLGKPFAMAELLSRLRALLRRPSAMRGRSELKFSDMILLPNERIIKRDGQELTLSGRECAMLELFFENAGCVLSRSQILGRVWGGDELVEEGNVDNYIYFVRRRLRALGSSAVIKSVHGVGYQMTEGGKADG